MEKNLNNIDTALVNLPEEAGFQSERKNKLKIVNSKDEMPDENSEKISMKGIFKQILKQIKNKKIIFTCSNKKYAHSQDHSYKSCNVTLFTSSEINSIYVLNDKDFCYVLSDQENPKNKSTILKSEGLQFKDEEMKQEDCMYQELHCKMCKSIIGRYIFTTTAEKEVILNKLLIFSDKVDSFRIGEKEVRKIKMQDYLKISLKESEEIKEFTKTLENLSLCYNETLSNIDMNKDYLEFQKYVKNTYEYVETLTRLSKYVNYLQYKHNNTHSQI